MPRGRGRGRGTGRGRGRGRGGRGRSRGGGRGRSRSRNVPRQPQDENETKVPEDININTDVKKYFVGNATVEQHYNAQNENKNRYVAGMVALMKDGVTITQSKCFLSFDMHRGLTKKAKLTIL